MAGKHGRKLELSGDALFRNPRKHPRFRVKFDKRGSDDRPTSSVTTKRNGNGLFWHCPDKLVFSEFFRSFWCNIDQLMVVIRRAMEASRLRRENSSLKRREVTSAEMIGQSAAFRALVGQLDKVTKSNGRVMLTGPAGSGKEIAARYIHAHSNRASAPFVTVNCA